MVIQDQLSRPRAGARETGVLSTLTVPADEADGLPDLLREMAATPMAVIALFVSPQADFGRLMRRAAAALADTPLIGCTTAGEITGAGYDEGAIVAVGFPSSLFAARVVHIGGLGRIDEQQLIDRIVHERLALNESAPGMPNKFAFLMVDGLSLKEDALTAAMAPALAEIPLFGGSAGDGTDFRRTFVGVGAQTGQNAAVLTLIRTRCEAKVFTLNNLEPRQTRMVVTEADPERRVVKTINAEPAAREYARLVGKDPDQLDRFTFAAHPVVVRIGDEHHVRAIQRVSPKGELVFFSAIDEGMVLTVAEATDMVDHLEGRLAELGARQAPAAILACDCILRRIEALQSQQVGAVSTVLTRHRVTGFSTYGEQIGPLHINQTMTGVALYPPKPDAPN